MGSLARWRPSLLGFALIASAYAAPAAAASYTQNFQLTTPPADWVNAGGMTYALEQANGNTYYHNPGANGSVKRAIAYHNGSSWSTNYTYDVKLNSDFEAEGNQVGVVFNLVDENNYYEVVISVRSATFAGKAALRKVVNGNVDNATVLATLPATAVPANWPENDTFFPVRVVRNGNTATVTINGFTAFNAVNLGSPASGHIGFFAAFNHGRFDDVNVADSGAPPLFRSGFETGTNLTSMVCRSGMGQQNLTGTESATGTVWPPTFWGAPTAQLFNTGALCNTDAPDQLYDDQIRIALINSADAANSTLGLPKGIKGPTGTDTRYLYGHMKEWDNSSTPPKNPRSGITYQFADRDANGADRSPPGYYVRRYLHYPTGIVANIGTYGWFIQNEYKTACDGAVDGRIIVRIHKLNVKGTAYYELNRDWYNNCPQNSGNTLIETLASCVVGSNAETCPALPENAWFYDEFYVRVGTSATDKGVVKYAINGKVIFNYTPTAGTGTGPTYERLPDRINRIKMTPGYLNLAGQELLTDDVEMYSEPPCGSFPCGAPTHVN